MQRATLDRLRAAGRKGPALVRALDVASGEERIIDPATDLSALGRAAAAALGRETSLVTRLDGREWLMSVYIPPPELVIVGAVHIAQALAALALSAGYRVRVIDPRPVYGAPDRFPDVEIVTQWPDDALAAAPLTGQSAVVVLSHDAKIDDPALMAALRSPTGYIGALGSKRTHAKRLERLAALGFSEKALARIHGPVGLSIGARTPSEIAVSILAELVKVRRAAKPGPRIAGIVLAAGLSSRMGHNKLLAKIDGRPLVRHALDGALTSALDPLIVVTGHEAQAVRAVLDGCPVTFAHNPAHRDGLSASLRVGIAAVPAGCDGALVLLGDMPAIPADLIARAVDAFDPGASRAICVATAKGERGHPVLFGRQFFAEIETLSGDTGARSLLASHAASVCEIEADDMGPLIDLDTPDALAVYGV